MDLTSLAPTFAKIAAAQRHLVRAAEAVSAHLLQGPMHANIVPVAQYNQFARLERMVNSQAVALARQRWDELTAERDRWTANVFDALVGKPG